MDASPAVSDAPRTGEEQLNGNADGGEEMQSNVKANVEDGGEVEPADIDINVENIPTEKHQDERQSASPVCPSPSSEDSSSDTSSTDEEALRAEDHLRPSLCIDDVGIFPDDKVGGAVLKHTVAAQQRTSEQTRKSETIYEMTRKYVHHFTTLHVERERDAHGVYVCVSCSSAQRTLAEIREAIRNDREGRRVALVNATFMKLLVQLCNLDSFDMPRICAVSSEEMLEYYRTASVTEIVGTATLLEDEQSERVWKCFFGAAAYDIRKKTYAVKVRKNLRTDNGGYNGVDAFHKRATKRIQSTAEANASPRIDADSLIIANCLDAKHVIVYDSSKAKEDAKSMDVLMTQNHQSSRNREPRREPPYVGDIVGLVLSSDCVQRALIVKVTGYVSLVWSIDHGCFHNVKWAKLINVAPSLRNVPPAVALAVLDDVDVVPFVKLLRECVKVLRVVTDHDNHEETFHVFMVNKVIPFGVIGLLTDLLHCPDYVTRMTAADCLITMCSRHNGRQAVARATCVPKVLLRLCDLTRRRYQGDNDGSSLTKVTAEKRVLLNLLQAVFFRNDQLCLEYADTELLAIVLRVRKSLPRTGTIHLDVERCLRAIVGPSQGRHSSQQQQQQQPKQQQYQKPPEYRDREQQYGGYHQGPGTNSSVYRRQPPVRRREPAPRAQAKLVAITPEKLNDKTASSCYPMSEALQCAGTEAAASRSMPTQIPKPTTNVPPSSACTGDAAAASPPCGRFYIRGTLVPLRSDETHEVLPVGSMKQASARTLANVVCSFLNTWRPCSIYYGINAEGFVRGVVLNQEERDALQRCIDFMVGNLRPHLTPTSFGVEFMPVLRHAADKPEEAYHFVVEVKVCGVYRIVYTTSDGDCYLRVGDMSYQAGTHDVRAWTVRVEEEHYLHAKSRATQKGEAAPTAEVAPLSVGDAMA